MAVDESPASQDAVQWAKEKLVQKDDEVHLVSVLNSGHDNEGFSGMDGSYQSANGNCKPNPFELERRCRILKEYQETLRPATAKVDMTALVTCVPGASEIGREIVHLAENTHADLVVIGSRGMGNAEKAVMSLFGLGSVSDFVVRHCRNVLVHRPQQNRIQNEETRS